MLNDAAAGTMGWKSGDKECVVFDAVVRKYFQCVIVTKTIAQIFGLDSVVRTDARYRRVCATFFCRDNREQASNIATHHSPGQSRTGSLRGL